MNDENIIEIMKELVLKIVKDNTKEQVEINRQIVITKTTAKLIMEELERVINDENKIN